MGGDKSKKHKKRRHSDDETDSSDTSSGEDRKAKKHKKEKKHKHKHHKHKSVDKELVEQAKEFLKQQLGNVPGPPGSATDTGATGPAIGPGADRGGRGGPPTAGPLPAPPGPHAGPRIPVEVKEPISSASYFERNVEFTAWLLEEKRMYFNELSSDQSRAMFEEFVRQWNAGRLDERYYQGQVEAPRRRTQHVWGFASKQPAASPGGPVGVAAFLAEHQDKRDAKRAGDQMDRRNERREREGLMDELLPKATGREAMVEKRMARREDARARATSPDIVHVPGGRGDLMGGDDSFEAAKAREARQQQFHQGKHAARSAELNVRQAAFQATEDAKMEQFRRLVAQGPITIAKRQLPPS